VGHGLDSFGSGQNNQYVLRTFMLQERQGVLSCMELRDLAGGCWLWAALQNHRYPGGQLIFLPPIKEAIYPNE